MELRPLAVPALLFLAAWAGTQLVRSGHEPAAGRADDETSAASLASTPPIAVAGAPSAGASPVAAAPVSASVPVSGTGTAIAELHGAELFARLYDERPLEAAELRQLAARLAEKLPGDSAAGDGARSGRGRELRDRLGILRALEGERVPPELSEQLAATLLSIAADPGSTWPLQRQAARDLKVVGFTGDSRALERAIASVPPRIRYLSELSNDELLGLATGEEQ